MFLLPLPKTVTWIYVPSVTLVWTKSSKVENRSMFPVMWLMQPESKYHMSHEHAQPTLHSTGDTILGISYALGTTTTLAINIDRGWLFVLCD